MTAPDSAALEKLLAEATPGPWSSEEKGDHPYPFVCGPSIQTEFGPEGFVVCYLVGMDQAANAALIALAPTLAAEVIALRAKDEALRIDRDEWQIAAESAMDKHGALIRQIDALRAENEDLKSSVVAFCSVYAVKYAADFDLPKGHLHAAHYDILKAAGARMDDFTRAVVA